MSHLSGLFSPRIPQHSPWLPGTPRERLFPGTEAPSPPQRRTEMITCPTFLPRALHTQDWDSLGKVASRTQVLRVICPASVCPAHHLPGEELLLCPQLSGGVENMVQRYPSESSHEHCKETEEKVILGHIQGNQH